MSIYIIYFRKALAAFVIFLLTLFPLISFRVLDNAILSPAIEFVVIFYFCIFRFKKEVILYSFFYSLIVDLVHYLPLGATAISLLTFAYILNKYAQVLLSKSFVIIYITFSLACSLYSLTKYLTICIVYQDILLYQPTLIQLLSTIALYPIGHSILHNIDRYLLE